MVELYCICLPFCFSDKPRLDEADKDSIGPKLNEALLSSKAEEDMKREEENKEAEEKRKNHVREWDKEKMESRFKLGRVYSTTHHALHKES